MIVEILAEIDHRAKELHAAGVLGREAEEEAPGKEVHDPIPQGGQEVQKEIESGENKDVARQKGAEGGDAEEGQALPDDAQDGDEGPPGIKAAAAGEEDRGEAPGHGVGDQHHGKAGEEVRQEEALPPDGQGVHEAHAPGVVEIVPDRHGAEDGVAEGDDGDSIAEEGIVPLPHHQGRDAQVPLVHHLH